MTTRAETAARRETIRTLTEELRSTVLGHVFVAAVARGIVTEAQYATVQSDLLKLGLGQVCKRADGTRSPIIRSARRVTDDAGPLRHLLLSACADTGLQMEDLTVLTEGNDPYRFDTPAKRRDGQWLAAQVARLGVRLPLHPRGIHYALVAAGDVIKPNGKLYINDYANWNWLINDAVAAARWNGDIPFTDILDERNTPPVFRISEEPEAPYVGTSFDIDISIPDDIEPEVYVSKFVAPQRHQLVLFGEKTSLEPILAPLAERYGASLCLPTGEASNKMVYDLAKHLAEDDRPAVVFYFADCDPAGYGMSISVARKLQALHDLKFEGLEVQMRHVGLTPAQVKELGLPSSPLKVTEKRSQAWKDAFGIEQTEIDALATLRPEVLRKMAEQAIAPFFDKTLARRCRETRAEYQQMAEEAFAEQADEELLESLRERAKVTLDELRDKVAELSAEMRSVTDKIDLDLPEPEVPEAKLDGVPTTEAIFDTDWSYTEASRYLIARKAYALGEK